jgi:uncharacterized protein YbcI
MAVALSLLARPSRDDQPDRPVALCRERLPRGTPTSLWPRARELPLSRVSLPSDWIDEPADRGSAGGLLADAIGAQIVDLLRQHTGKGPTQARAAMSSNLVVITLADCLTIAERRLAAAGHGELITSARSAIHQGMRSEATTIVEEFTHRQVAAYLTDQENDPDLTVIIFYLAPPVLRLRNGHRNAGR